MILWKAIYVILFIISNMEVIKIDKIKLEELVDKLKQGAVIVYPTETCYGLGCDATNEEAVTRVFRIKKRQQTKTVLVLMDESEMAMRYVDWNPVLEKIANRYWPGPLTVVTKIRNGVSLPKGVEADDRTMAFRVSSHPLVESIVSRLGKPLVSTSANIQSLANPYDVKQVVAMFAESLEKPDIIIDAGELPNHSPSTVVRVNKRGGLEVLRQGEIIVK